MAAYSIWPECWEQHLYPERDPLGSWLRAHPGPLRVSVLVLPGTTTIAAGQPGWVPVCQCLPPPPPPPIKPPDPWLAERYGWVETHTADRYVCPDEAV
jgi:hypothetical protein